MSSTNNNNGKKPRWSHADKAGAKRELDKLLAANTPFAQADEARALLKTL